ncbi:hypothetical protein NC653_035882 [Populus alba x Populus x berolinensis]|uniref:Uncharacterized protein n=1 Tax=Populus alba x Populus x berolinensis TaxID=444605 RepID=A0AAD6LK02_9ROSI|nr:hypothetical protein NC653_035882 [Populus alba x Populus x berolinensis]
MQDLLVMSLAHCRMNLVLYLLSNTYI